MNTTVALGILQAIITLIPLGADTYLKVKRLIGEWYGKGMISAETQNELYKWADKEMRSALAGDVPPELTVEPNPQ